MTTHKNFKKHFHITSTVRKAKNLGSTKKKLSKLRARGAKRGTLEVAGSLIEQPENECRYSETLVRPA